MRTFSRFVGYVSLGLLGLFASIEAQAASNRIFISTTGNNANDCSSPLTPCIDFTGAFSQVSDGGEIIAEATGPYGPLNVTKGVTISGPPGVVIYSGHQVTVNAPGATVVLRGLTIDGNGATENGINVVAVDMLFVESCVIAGFAGSSTSQGNGIFFGSAGNLFIKDTIVRKNGFVAIWVHPASGNASASVANCRIEGNLLGLDSYTNAFTTVRDSTVSGNQNEGLLAEHGGELNLESCMVANNGIGIFSGTGPAALVRVSNTTVTDNATGLSTSGNLLSRSNNTLEGNGTNGTFTGTFSAH